MKDTMESVAAVLKDAERQSVRKDKESVRLWLKRLKHAALDISDMMDDYQDTLLHAQPTAAKVSGMFCCLTAARKKMVLANKMKTMRQQLERINKERRDFTFTESSAAMDNDRQLNEERETTSYVKEEEILGRDGEKKDIAKLLSSNHSKDGLMVLPIYGLGGMGKTTLAKLVYNDTQFKQYYDRRVWVYVSQEFNLKRIGTSIISQLSEAGAQRNTTNELQLIRQTLNDLLLGKKILIVLDDIWEEDDFKLKDLKYMLDKKGGMVDIIVTTRSKEIADKICSNNVPYELKPLKDHLCWDIIKRYSGFKDKSNKGELEQIGLALAKKCGGVALAAQALGYTLRSKDLYGWAEVKNSDIWNDSSRVDNSQHMKVLPSLKLSYERMQPILRLCFSYCAIFPKGHEIFEDDLVHQWVALDFIKKPSEGKEYIKQLLGMSFLHSEFYSRSEGLRYTMHDLVHDLATLVIGDELFVIDVANWSNNTCQMKFCRYILLTNYDGHTKLSNILPKKVRALHFSSTNKFSGPGDGLFSSTKCLRVLDFSRCPGVILPSSIGQLNQLRCLIAPEVLNDRLPESMAKLSKPQYLNLRQSSVMSALPESIGKLDDLIYLGLSYCRAISKLPEELFGGLKNLMHLDMSYCSGITILPESLGGLKSLKYLAMSGCSGITILPESLGELKSLTYLDMSFCSGITILPESVGALQSLTHLDISGCSRIIILPDSVGGLESLMYLNISYCSQINILPESLGELKNLTQFVMLHCSGITILPESLDRLESLAYLNMSFCSGITILPESLGGLKNLMYLTISCCSGITTLPQALGHLTNLRYLNLSECSGVEEIPEFLCALSQLKHLNLSDCVSITSLPEAIGSLINLEYLNLSKCVNLKSLPDGISDMTKLESLLMEQCSDEVIHQANSRLHYSITLPDFTVRADSINACSNLTLLEDVNVRVLRVHSLENVMFPEEARRVRLLGKSKLSNLTLRWTLHVDRLFLDDMDVLGQLVPPGCLESMNLKGYNSPSFPSWLMNISAHLPNLSYISLDGLLTCIDLPPLGQLPNLWYLFLTDCPRVQKIDMDFCGGKGAFPRLIQFELKGMRGLEEWSTTYSVEKDGDTKEEFMFPDLEYLNIHDCPVLRLKPCPPTIVRECTIEASDQVVSSMEELELDDNRLASSKDGTLALRIRGSDRMSLMLFHRFPALRALKLSRCPNLTRLPEGIRRLTSLEKLTLDQCGGIPALPEWMAELSSLEGIHIKCCESIDSLPLSLQQLTKLRKLLIVGNPNLKRWCESEENKKKLGHINDVLVFVDCD